MNFRVYYVMGDKIKSFVISCIDWLAVITCKGPAPDYATHLYFVKIVLISEEVS